MKTQKTATRYSEKLIAGSFAVIVAIITTIGTCNGQGLKAGRDATGGDKVNGDKVNGDKVGGNKIGTQIIGDTSKKKAQ